MKRRSRKTCLTAVLLLAGFVLISAAPDVIEAHHSYAAFDRNAQIVLEGTVTEVLWANPHIVLSLETESGPFRVEWLAVRQMAQYSIYKSPVQKGDRLKVTASVHRDPEIRVATLVRVVERPSDGWRWQDARN